MGFLKEIFSHFHLFFSSDKGKFIDSDLMHVESEWNRLSNDLTKSCLLNKIKQNDIEDIWIHSGFSFMLLRVSFYGFQN